MNWIKRLFGQPKKPAPSTEAYQFKWYELGPDNPFPVRILDVRSLTGTVVATTSNKDIAERYLTLRGSDKTAHTILGAPDDLKFCSCLTLFRAVAAPDDPLWQNALDQFYAGRPDETTLRLLNPSA